MTLVLCWLDESHGLVRLSAVADSRASRETDGGGRAVVSELTPKLFSLPVRCHRLENLELGTGAWKSPYHETTVGLGYTGNCFEALAVIAHIQRCFSQLCIVDDDPSAAPVPEPEGLVSLAGGLLDRFIEAHVDSGDLTVRFLMFGWSADGRPWMAKFGWDGGQRDPAKLITAGPKIIWAIGTDPGATRQAASSRRVNDARVARSEPSREGFEADLQTALARLSTSRTAEQAVKDVVADPAWASVGGRLEKLELFRGEGSGGAFVAMTHDRAGDFWQGLPLVSQTWHLGYLPVAAGLGE